MKNKKLFLLCITLCSLLIGGCGVSPTNQVASPSPSSSTTKSGTTSVTGVLKVTGKTAVLTSKQGAIGLDSYSVDFAQYDSQTVTVTGKYSGDTLYVSSITKP
jgi:hypothetical protein